VIVDAIAGAVGKIVDWRRSKTEAGVKKAALVSQNKAKVLEFRTRELEALEKRNIAQANANIAAAAHNAKFTFRDFALWSAAIAWSLHLFSGVLAWVMKAFFDRPDFPSMPHDSQLFYILSSGLGVGVAYRSFEKVKGVSRTCLPKGVAKGPGGAINIAKGIVERLRAKGEHNAGLQT